MATVELRFSALPAHVRTARLVAAAVARRAGVDEALLDEVRLAVGEACSRAVEPAPHAPVSSEPVAIDLTSTTWPVRRRGHRLRSRSGAARRMAGDTTRRRRSRPPGDTGEDAFGLAVISGLVDDVVDPSHRGIDRMLVRMTTGLAPTGWTPAGRVIRTARHALDPAFGQSVYGAMAVRLAQA